MNESIYKVSAIRTPDDAFQAAGFVLDVILANGRVDDDLGIAADLCPTEIAWRPDGSIASVFCNVQRGSNDLQPAHHAERILITA